MRPVQTKSGMEGLHKTVLRVSYDYETYSKSGRQDLRFVPQKIFASDYWHPSKNFPQKIKSHTAMTQSLYWSDSNYM